MTQATQPILSVSGLTKKFGRTTALHGIDFEISEPGVYGFLGPNGAGKSTTFKIICGLLRPSAGRVTINGTDVAADPRTALSQIGMHFDSPAHYPYLTGPQNLRVIARWLGRNLDSRIDELLELVGLADARSKRVSAYSWGMKQRLSLAAALLSDPRLVMMDEPTNGLDPAGIADVRRLLPKLAYEQGRTVFLSSHRMEEVEQICDHVTIIDKGRIAGSGKPSELASADAWIEVECRAPEQAIEALAGMTQQPVERLTTSRFKMFAPGVERRCINPDCGRMHFPRTDPAVITLVHDGPRCLLARRSTWGFNRRSTIAGFVEIGEMLEDAVRREILEEVGVEVTDVRYHSSQPWPFPCSLMLGFMARATTTEITVDGDEIAAAAWYTREELAEQTSSGELVLPPVDSISHRLVNDWIENGPL